MFFLIKMFFFSVFVGEKYLKMKFGNLLVRSLYGFIAYTVQGTFN